MNMRDKIAAIIEALQDNDFDNSMGAADDILAALPDMIPDLVWEVGEYGHFHSGIYEISFSANRKRAELHIYSTIGTDIHISGDNSDVLVNSMNEYANAHNKAQLAKAMGWTV